MVVMSANASVIGPAATRGSRRVACNIAGTITPQAPALVTAPAILAPMVKAKAGDTRSTNAARLTQLPVAIPSMSDVSTSC